MDNMLLVGNMIGSLRIDGDNDETICGACWILNLEREPDTPDHAGGRVLPCCMDHWHAISLANMKATDTPACECL